MYDAIIIGARCAGAPTAMLLARAGHRILLLDKSTFPSDKLSTHYIQPSGVQCLEEWGLLDAVIATVWAALTDPSRLVRWYGDIEGDLRLGGEYRAHLFSSGWEGTGRVEACEPPHRLQVRVKDPDEPDEHVSEVSLTADGSQTTVVLEERGLPLELLSAYGAGIQIHVEDLADHLAGRERRDDAKARWDELHPTYQAMAADLS